MEENGNGAVATRDFSKVSEESFSDRFRRNNPRSTTVCGLLLILFVTGAIFGAIVVLVWNEGNIIAKQRALDEGGQVVVFLPTIDTIDPAYEGKLVHLVGPLQTLDIVEDDIFGVTTGNLGGNNTGANKDAGDGNNPLILQRTAEMFQWVEEETKHSSGKNTYYTYSYHQAWRSDHIDSNAFNEPRGHQNPTSMPYQSTSFKADHITLGAFTLSGAVVDHLDWFTDYRGSYSTETIKEVALQNNIHGVTATNVGFFIGVNANTSDVLTPVVGDMRISFQVVNAQTASVVAQQSGNQLTPYTTTNGRSLLLLQPGNYTSESMFEQADTGTTPKEWGLRCAGFLLLFAGLLVLSLITLQPNNCCTLVCYVFLVSLLLTIAVIALTWITYQPTPSIIILSVVCATLGFAYYYQVVRPKLEGNATTEDDHGVGLQVERDAEIQVERDAVDEEETEIQVKGDDEKKGEVEIQFAGDQN